MILIIVVVAGPGQGKAGKAGKAGETGPGQSKPRQGTTSKPAKPRQAFWLAGWKIPKMSCKGPPGPWGP